MVFLYACTIFFSAFLLFQVQPIIGKMILPWFGGSAAVWSTCMLFFQCLLLLGYLYAHLTIRYFSPKKQATLHIFLIGLSLFLLPITPNEAWKPEGADDPTLSIIGLMIGSIGLQYFLLSSTGPLIQAWFAREKPGSVPYRLFALSNFGSMLGLLTYPLFFEPMLSVRMMSSTWSVAFACFALICAALAARGFRSQNIKGSEFADLPHTSPTTRERLHWLALAAFPTILLMAITSHLTQNVAPVPLLWVLPLAIYLLTFILCFEGEGWYRRRWYLPIFIFIVPVMIFFVAVPHLISSGIGWPIILFCSALFICCMVCHGELFKIKPHASFLTSFYLMIALGGAIGGIFVAVMAPRMFNDDYELVIAAIAILIVVFSVLYHQPDSASHKFLKKDVWSKAVVFGVTLVSILVIARYVLLDKQDIRLRNFYGTVKVNQHGDGQDTIKHLAHGVIRHGFQYIDPEKRRWPTAYYGEKSGVGLGLFASRSEHSQRVGVVGLGVGTMAAYCRKGDYYRFYEINPLVAKLAESEFSFLSDCPAKIEIALGDARLSLEKEKSQNFDLLVLDAFSGDSIPVHLLTREAFANYFRHLNKDGILAVHISNRNLNLIPVVKDSADHYHRDSFIVNSPSVKKKGEWDSEWILIVNQMGVDNVQRIGGQIVRAYTAKEIRPWTDNYSSILGILK